MLYKPKGLKYSLEESPAAFQAMGKLSFRSSDFFALAVSSAPSDPLYKSGPCVPYLPFLPFTVVTSGFGGCSAVNGQWYQVPRDDEFAAWPAGYLGRSLAAVASAGPAVSPPSRMLFLCFCVVLQVAGCRLDALLRPPGGCPGRPPGPRENRRVSLPRWAVQLSRRPPGRRCPVCGARYGLALKAGFAEIGFTLPLLHLCFAFALLCCLVAFVRFADRARASQLRGARAHICLLTRVFHPRTLFGGFVCPPSRPPFVLSLASHKAWPRSTPRACSAVAAGSALAPCRRSYPPVARAPGRPPC